MEVERSLSEGAGLRGGYSTSQLQAEKLRVRVEEIRLTNSVWRRSEVPQMLFPQIFLVAYKATRAFTTQTSHGHSGCMSLRPSALPVTVTFRPPVTIKQPNPPPCVTSCNNTSVASPVSSPHLLRSGCLHVTLMVANFSPVLSPAENRQSTDTLPIASQ